MKMMLTYDCGKTKLILLVDHAGSTPLGYMFHSHGHERELSDLPWNADSLIRLRGQNKIWCFRWHQITSISCKPRQGRCLFYFMLDHTLPSRNTVSSRVDFLRELSGKLGGS
jgi:hypothetical protein